MNKRQATQLANEVKQYGYATALVKWSEGGYSVNATSDATVRIDNQEQWEGIKGKIEHTRLLRGQA